MSTAFDTHAAVKRLCGAGFNESQAEALTDTVHTAITGGVATKADLIKVEAKIDAVEGNLNAKIDVVDTRLSGRINLVQWMVGFNLAFTLAMVWKLFA